MENQSQSQLFEYSALQRVRLGGSALQALQQELQLLEGRRAPVVPGVPAEQGSEAAQRVFIVASRTLSQHTAAISQLQRGLGPLCVGVFDQVGAHTPRSSVLVALQQARDAQATLLVSVGGGSVIDAAKAVQFGLNVGIRSEKELLAYAQFSDGRRGEKAGTADAQAGSGVRHIAIPTTLSGAEFSGNAGVTDTARGAKEGYKAPGLCPQSIIYDPGLSLHTPQWLWLSTAIRALDHAVEGYCSADSHAYMHAQYLHALRLFSSSLRQMKQKPESLAVRSINQQATWLACCALGKVRHGASHGIGYILGALCRVPHGYTSCVMLPSVLRWNAQHRPERQVAIAEALGEPGSSAAQAVKNLLVELGLPTTLREVGVAEQQLREIAELAAKHSVVRSNPRTISSAADVMEILRLAW